MRTFYDFVSTEQLNGSDHIVSKYFILWKKRFSEIEFIMLENELMKKPPTDLEPVIVSIYGGLQANLFCKIKSRDFKDSITKELFHNLMKLKRYNQKFKMTILKKYPTKSDFAVSYSNLCSCGYWFIHGSLDIVLSVNSQTCIYQYLVQMTWAKFRFKILAVTNIPDISSAYKL